MEVKGLRVLLRKFDLKLDILSIPNLASVFRRCIRCQSPFHMAYASVCIRSLLTAFCMHVHFWDRFESHDGIQGTAIPFFPKRFQSSFCCCFMTIRSWIGYPCYSREKISRSNLEIPDGRNMTINFWLLVAAWPRVQLAVKMVSNVRRCDGKHEASFLSSHVF